MIVELFHSVSRRVDETTYFGESFMNGAPGSSSAVRADHVGANSSYVLRPISSALLGCMIPAIAPPIFGSNAYPIVHAGLSITPSSVMNSCTTIRPIVISFPRRPMRRFVSSTNGDREIDSAPSSCCLSAPGEHWTTCAGAKWGTPGFVRVAFEPAFVCAARAREDRGGPMEQWPRDVGG